MSLIQAKCNNCGANLEFDDSRENVFCSNCGTKFIRENPVTVNIGNINIGNTGTPPRVANYDYTFNMSEYATPFEKDEKHARQEWIGRLMSFPDAPLDLATKATNVKIIKEYYPVAFVDVTCDADWTALSYWEHDEPYQVVEKHFNIFTRETEYRRVTKHNWITDVVKETKGTVPIQKYPVKVWMGPIVDKISSVLLSWIDVDTKCIEVKENYLNDYEVIPSKKTREDAYDEARKIVVEKMQEKVAACVPGDRYENLHADVLPKEILITTRYLGVYHIKYTYAGKDYELYTACNDDAKKVILFTHPVDSFVPQKMQKLQQDASSLSTKKTLLLVGAILGPIILGAIWMSFMNQYGGRHGVSTATLVIVSIIILLLAAAIIATCVIFFIKVNKKHAIALEKHKTYKSRIADLKKKIYDLNWNDSIPEENKASMVEQWMNETC